MLTKYFPYGTGEAFIENEISEFAKQYDKIYIIACEVQKDETYVRTVPENVMYFRVPAKCKSIQKVRDMICGISNIFSLDSEFKNELGACNAIKQKLFLAYFEAKSKRIYRSIMKLGIIDEIEHGSYVLYSYWLFTTARVGILISKQKKPRYMISRAHGYDLYEYRNSIKYLPFRKLFLEKYNLILPCSNDGTRHIQEKYQNYLNKVETAYLGTLDNGIGKYSTDGVFRIVSCSRISSEKRVEKILEALSLIKEKKIFIEWTHIGDGCGLEKLKKDASSLPNNISVSFIGNLPNKKVLEFYKNNKVDLFINVSSSEGLPVSIMEAISFGIPVIATDVGGTSEIVINDLNGILIKKDFRSNELAKKIVLFEKYKSDERYLEYRVQCRKYWENNFMALHNYKYLCLKIENNIKDLMSRKEI